MTLALLIGAAVSVSAECAHKTHFTFNWPVPSKGTAELQTDNNGAKTHTKSKVALVEGTTRGELQLVMSDFEFLPVDSSDTTAQPWDSAGAFIAALSSAAPPLVISTDGHFLRVDQWDQFVDSSAALLGGTGPDTIAGLAEQWTLSMKAPETREAVQAASAENWRLWVEAWKDLTLCRGTSAPSVYRLALPFGGQVDAAAEVTYLAADSTDTTSHQLHVSSTASGPQVREASIEWMKKTLARFLSPDDLASLNATIGDCSITFEATVTTNPSTLMPTQVFSSKTIRISDQYGTTEEQVEKQKYTFKWE